MITPPIGAERTQLVKWSTPRLLRYFKSRRKSATIYRKQVLGWDAQNITMKEFATKQEQQTYDAMVAEIDYIQRLLNGREHVERT